MWHGVRRFSFARQSALRVGGVALEERRGGRRKALGVGGRAAPALGGGSVRDGPIVMCVIALLVKCFVVLCI